MAAPGTAGIVSGIAWREKLVAFAVHFLLTAIVALAAAALIFLVWFPEPLSTMIGGTELFLLVVGCDLALGPLLSLVIYDSRKSTGKLLFDYSVVGILQVAALLYGVSVVADSRPVYIVFVGDRLEVVMAGDIADEDLAAALDPAYRTKPRWKAELIATFVRPEDHNDAVFSGLAGKDIQVQPHYYVPYGSQIERVKTAAKPLGVLEARQPQATPLLVSASRELGLDAEQLRWLPVRHRTGFWIALFDAQSGMPLRYLPIDPYGAPAGTGT